MNTLRPDELSALHRIEKEKKSDSLIKKGAETFLTAGTAALGFGLGSKILPFLNEFIPADLALKGINKVAPKIGQFLQKGQKMGLDIKEGLQFLKDNLEGEKSQERQQENPVIKQAKDFETNYPDIVQALIGYINKGQSPQAAAAIIKTATPFVQKVKKIEKETGKNFIDFILELMGGQQNGQIPQQSAQGMQPQTQGIPNQAMQQIQGNQQGKSQGLDPQLAQIMQGIRSTIQGIRGGNG